jgi:hypothetical protein
VLSLLWCFGISSDPVPWPPNSAAQRGRRSPYSAFDGLTTAEREELNQLRRENRQLRLKRDILSKAAAWFARDEHDPTEGFRFVSDNQAEFPSPPIRPIHLH